MILRMARRLVTLRPGCKAYRLAPHLAWLSALLLAGACAGMEAPAPPASATIPSTTQPPPTQTPTPIPPTQTPTPSPTSTPDCRNDPGRLQAQAYQGVAIAGEVPVEIYLPPCFDEAEQGLPVVYLLHGKPFDESHWTSLGLLAVVEARVRDGSWPPFVIVLPRVPEPLFSSSDGGPGSYETEFLEGLIPAMEAAFPIRSESAYRALAGISRGGIWALEIGLRNPGVLSRVGALSPSLAVNYPRSAYDPFLLAEQSQDFPDVLYLAAGDSDWALPETRRLAAIFEARGASVGFVIVPGGHEDATWSALLESAVGSLIAGW